MLSMKRNHGLKINQRGVRKFFVAALTLFLVSHPAFHEFEDIKEIELISPQPILEKIHFADMASGKSDKPQELNSNSSAPVLPLESIHLKDFLHHSSPIFFSSQQDSVLRC